MATLFYFFRWLWTVIIHWIGDKMKVKTELVESHESVCVLCGKKIITNVYEDTLCGFYGAKAKRFERSDYECNCKDTLKRIKLKRQCINCMYSTGLVCRFDKCYNKISVHACENYAFDWEILKLFMEVYK